MEYREFKHVKYVSVLSPDKSTHLFLDADLGHLIEIKALTEASAKIQLLKEALLDIAPCLCILPGVKHKCTIAQEALEALEALESL